MQPRKTLIESFWDLPEAAQSGMARFLVGAKLGEIVETRSAAGLEFEVHYFRHGTVHKIAWDTGLGRLSGATESMVLQAMLAQMDGSARMSISKVEGRLRHLKIKRDSKDGHPFLHVHFVDHQRVLGSAAPVVLDLVDGSALLWRLQLRGAAVGDRGQVDPGGQE